MGVYYLIRNYNNSHPRYEIYFTDDNDKLFCIEHDSKTWITIDEIMDVVKDKITFMMSLTVDRNMPIHHIQEWNEFRSFDFESFKIKMEKLIVTSELLK